MNSSDLFGSPLRLPLKCIVVNAASPYIIIYMAVSFENVVSKEKALAALCASVLFKPIPGAVNRYICKSETAQLRYIRSATPAPRTLIKTIHNETDSVFTFHNQPPGSKYIVLQFALHFPYNKSPGLCGLRCNAFCVTLNIPRTVEQVKRFLFIFCKEFFFGPHHQKGRCFLKKQKEDVQVAFIAIRIQPAIKAALDKYCEKNLEKLSEAVSNAIKNYIGFARPVANRPEKRPVQDKGRSYCLNIRIHPRLKVALVKYRKATKVSITYAVTSAIKLYIGKT